ncbi:MAG: small subunit ribosomal protein [Solirubrobacteraceae bacterium]|jgi:small subunit ribosomal protein S9|nr:small subunit ribosomal protein [Solirubrobacteraceae bacterium]
MMADDDHTKGSEQGEVDEPQEIAAESASGDQEQPTERQQEREQAIVDEPVAESEQRIAEAAAPAQPAGAGEAEDADEDDEDDEPAAPRVKPEIPGMDLEPDIVLEGEDREEDEDSEEASSDEDEDAFSQPIADAAIDLGAGARYRATGKRKRAVARVILKPGTGAYTINGRELVQYFPRDTLQRTIRQPLETVGFEERMDVVALMHGGGVSAQADALRHGISRALLEADPNLRGELKRRGFLTRDARAKERKKAGLKKARKRPQFSKR